MQVSVAAHRGRHILRCAAPPGGELRAARAWSTYRSGELVRRPDVDVVDICTPPGTHAEIATAAAAAGKAVICEKPLAVSYAQAASVRDAVERAHVLNAVGFNYRRLPAVSLMKRMIDEGAVGKVRLVRGSWLSDEFVDPT